MVPRPSRHDRLALRHGAPLQGPGGIAAALGWRHPRRRSRHHRLVCSGRHRGGTLGAHGRAGHCRLLRHRHAGDAESAGRRHLPLYRRRPRCRASICTCRSPVDRRCASWRPAIGRVRRGPCIAASIPNGTVPVRAARCAGTSAISAPTAPTVSRRSTPFSASRRGIGATAVSRLPARSTRPSCDGQPMSRASSMSARTNTSQFYGRQRFTLNLTRADMIRLGYSPSVRLFEAAACGVPIISDWWPGLATILRIRSRDPDRPRRRRGAAVSARDAGTGAARIADAARARVLAAHTAEHRAAELEGYIAEVAGVTRGPDPVLEAAAGLAELPR